MTIHELNPQRVWKNFHSLTQIPRPSGYTEKVADFLVKFGKDNGLESFKDECGNVIIRKEATPGMENRKGVVLQAHMDMVPQKNNDKKHDFTKDPIQTRVVEHEGALWLYADGTTLGADDGLGVAAAMAILESKDLKHGPLEALFTVDEETKMIGAKDLKPNVLKGDILLNLDSETEGELYVGCAGSIDIISTFNIKSEPTGEGFKAFKVVVTGLRGGHSGMDIHEGRGNANKVLARLLLPLLKEDGARLASFDGGNMRNAIPREAEAVVAIPQGKEGKLYEAASEITGTLKTELARIDPGIIITVNPVECTSVMDKEGAISLVKSICACPNAVDRMSLEIGGLVDTSNNLAIVETEGDTVTVISMARGATDSMKMDLAERIKAAMELGGAAVEYDECKTGWSPNMDSPILKTMAEQYEKLYNRKPAVMAIHAGLECGVFSSTYPNWDMISCGPTLKSPHSPDERCEIESVGKWWNLLTATLEAVPEK